MHQVNSSQSLFSGLLHCPDARWESKASKVVPKFPWIGAKTAIWHLHQPQLGLVRPSAGGVGKVKKNRASKQPAELFGLHLVELSISQVPPWSWRARWEFRHWRISKTLWKMLPTLRRHSWCGNGGGSGSEPWDHFLWGANGLVRSTFNAVDLEFIVLPLWHLEGCWLEAFAS